MKKAHEHKLYILIYNLQKNISNTIYMLFRAIVLVGVNIISDNLL